MRGVLSTLRLVPKDRNWSPRPTFDLLDRLLGWLRAAGDYREKVERLAAWRDYLHALPEDGAVAVLAATIAFAEWFEEASLEALGAYTAHVERFLEAPRKAVIVPACLRYHPRPRCRALAGPLACECRGCEPRCRVRQLTRLGAAHGFDVLLVPHESSVFAGEAGRQLLGDGAGVVGVTCVLNLLAGGWKALRLGLLPQCVLLDHCGCRKH